MNKPEVKVIEFQQEHNHPTEVTGSEAASLLAKYGYISNTSYSNKHQPEDAVSNKTAEEAFQYQFEQVQQRKMKNNVRPSTFDRNRVEYSETNYRDLDIDGQNLGIQVTVVTDMPINRR